MDRVLVMRRFLKHVELNPHGERLRDKFLKMPRRGSPDVDRYRNVLWAIGTAAIDYVTDSKCFLRERAARVNLDLRDLYREQRRLKKEVQSFTYPQMHACGLPLTAAGVVAIQEHEHRRQQLADRNAKIEGAKILVDLNHRGEYDDVGLVYYIRSLLNRPLGARIATAEPNDLMVILEAAAQAIGKPLRHMERENRRENIVLRRASCRNLAVRLLRFERSAKTTVFRTNVDRQFPARP